MSKFSKTKLRQRSSYYSKMQNKKQEGKVECKQKLAHKKLKDETILKKLKKRDRQTNNGRLG